MDSGSLRCEAAKSPGLGDRGSLSWFLTPSPESPSVCNVGGLRTFSMTWKQNFKTNSLPFLSSSAPVRKAHGTKGQTGRGARGSKGAALREARSPGCRGREGDCLPEAVCPGLASRHICPDHALGLVQAELTCSRSLHTMAQDAFSAHT